MIWFELALRHCLITRVDLKQARLADKKEHKQENQAAHLSNQEGN
jgi:hypothetical protein